MALGTGTGLIGLNMLLGADAGLSLGCHEFESVDGWKEYPRRWEAECDQFS
jgi:hypothetical protein